MQLRLEHINPDTRQGEVVALTPSVMLGYFKNPEATKEVFTEDVYKRQVLYIGVCIFCLFCPCNPQS